MPMFKLTGRESVITLHLEHPIHLYSGTEYRLALYGFYSENNISNLTTTGIMYFWFDRVETSGTVSEYRVLTLEPGYWTLETLQERCRQFIKTLNTNVDPNTFVMTKTTTTTNGTPTVSVYSPLKCAFNGVVARLLGFEPDETLYCQAGQTVTATKPPNLRATDVVEIQCNLVENSYSSHDEYAQHKHKEHRTLYAFYPAVPHGYKISETPCERYYVPLDGGLKKIQQITVALVDQDNTPLHNPFANNIVYLHLTKV